MHRVVGFNTVVSPHLESLDVTVQTLTIVPDRVETQHVAIVLDEPSPPAVVHRISESGLREDFHVVLRTVQTWGAEGKLAV